jgi:hypothetical protein
MLRDRALEVALDDYGSAVVAITDGDTSMCPHLAGGDAVLVRRLDHPPAAGDLLLYGQSDYWVVHRCLGAVVTKDGRAGLRTRGDGRNRLDPLLLVDDVRGRVIGVRHGGVWRSVRTPAARVYAKLVAWHDLSWAAAGVALRRIGLGAVAAAADRALLELTAPWLFPLLHRRLTPPAGRGSASAV